VVHTNNKLDAWTHDFSDRDQSVFIVGTFAPIGPRGATAVDQPIAPNETSDAWIYEFIDSDRFGFTVDSFVDDGPPSAPAANEPFAPTSANVYSKPADDDAPDDGPPLRAKSKSRGKSGALALESILARMMDAATSVYFWLQCMGLMGLLYLAAQVTYLFAVFSQMCGHKDGNNKFKKTTMAYILVAMLLSEQVISIFNHIQSLPRFSSPPQPHGTPGGHVDALHAVGSPQSLSLYQAYLHAVDQQPSKWVYSDIAIGEIRDVQEYIQALFHNMSGKVLCCLRP
jgi:hypothetical protein